VRRNGGCTATGAENTHLHFKIPDHDGIGDLKGIERRLELLVSLGVAAIWLSPITVADG
jgi:glycosidase